MKEVSSYAQSSDNAIATAEKFNNSMGNISADIWKDRTAMLGSKGMFNDQGTKCFGLTDLQIEGQDTKPTKGGCGGSTVTMEAFPNNPSSLDSPPKPFVKPEIPADGGPKDPIKESIKLPSKCDLRRPIQPYIIDSEESGEPVEPVQKPSKPGKPTKPSAVAGDTLV